MKYITPKVILNTPKVISIPKLFQIKLILLRLCQNAGFL